MTPVAALPAGRPKRYKGFEVGSPDHGLPAFAGPPPDAWGQPVRPSAPTTAKSSLPAGTGLDGASPRLVALQAPTPPFDRHGLGPRAARAERTGLCGRPSFHGVPKWRIEQRIPPTLGAGPWLLPFSPFKLLLPGARPAGSEGTGPGTRRAPEQPRPVPVLRRQRWVSLSHVDREIRVPACGAEQPPR